jgi:hypothetical protein
MNLKYTFFAAALLLTNVGIAQQGDGGNPNGYSYILKNKKSIDKKVFEEPNISALRAEDEINDELGVGPWRFGYNNQVSLDINNSGTWFTSPNGDKVWLLELESINAKTVNLTFENTNIPEGNELYVYNPDKSFILGKFESNHLYKGELGSELVPGSTVFVEYYVPAYNSDNIGNVEVSRVTHGYRTAGEYQEKAFGSSGACNMNVNCPDGSGWINQRNSAVLLVSGGSSFCSGALINNTSNDGTPYVLTANHCYSDPASWVFRFQWQAVDCTDPATSPSFESLSGATLRSRRTPSDFCLVEITGGLSNGTVPQSHTPYFAGWNNSNTAPSSTVSIHHPSGDIKKISFDDDASQAVQAMGSSEANSSWEVVWDRNTTTEGGSSGSPLFDQDKRIIGQLWGGGASCGNLSAPDYYGRVFNSWNPTGSSNAEQLEFWLDPNSSGVGAIDGYDPYFNPNEYDVALSDVQGADGIICDDLTNPVVTIRNNGSQTLTSATISYAYNGGGTLTINWTGSLTTFQSEQVNLPVFYAINGSNTVDVEVNSPNGQTDEDLGNNTANSSFTAVVEGEIITMDLTLDCFAEEISWRVEDGAGTVWYSGSGYQNPGNTTELVSEDFCLLVGCYELILDDTFGDGLNGSGFNGCDFDGSMQLTRDHNGAVLAELTEQNSDFGSSVTYPFCAEDVLDVNQYALESNISIYPNPSNGSFKVNVKVEGLKVVSLIDYTGKVISEKSSEDTVFGFNESRVSSGVYIVKIKTNKGVSTKKVIIE